MTQLLIVDDEAASRESLRAVFSELYKVLTASHAEEALALLEQHPVDLVFCDVIMPGRDGVSLLRDMQQRHAEIPVIMVSASNAVRPAVEAIREGAFDYINKPFEVEEVRALAKRALTTRRLQRRVDVLESEMSQAYPIDSIIGEAPVFQRALQHAEEAAASDATVLVTGESGTGKELMARLIHRLSGRHEEPFVAVHCAALPESLMESELFGYEKGAFTNADQRKLGRFDLAGAGSLFLDEIGEMSMVMQAKILRVLQEREYMRVGGTRVVRTEARIITATHRNLRKDVEEGRFREDLFYRLSVIPIHIPPLRERVEDIPLLARHFLETFRRSMDVRTRDFEPEALQRLSTYYWPGNVREMRNLVERMIVLHRRQTLVRLEFLPEEFQRPPNATLPTAPHCSLEDAVNAYERKLVEDALERAGGVQTRAAEMLGTTRRILRYRMEKLNIHYRKNL